MTVVGKEERRQQRAEPEMPWATTLATYYGFLILILVGHTRDFFAYYFGFSRYSQTNVEKGFAILLQSWESFFTRRLFNRVQDCWARPICSSPGARIEVMNRTSKDFEATFQLDGSTSKCINLGSYNYLGFADDWKETCRDHVVDAVDHWPVSMCSSAKDFGYNALHEELEQTVAAYIGKEAACVFNMGYGTNASVIPALMGPETLIISDQLNHTSIVNGSRASNCMIRPFTHNSPTNLEQVLREALIHGQPRHHRPWKKILVMVEGIYSMEGTVSHLKEIVAVAKKYKAYIYVDEAHSIGALGKTGRGVCEYTGVDPSEIDILMGTFTKSFSGMGGYIAASKTIIDHLKANCTALVYHTSMSPIVCAQVIRALNVIMGKDGSTVGVEKIENLAANANYMRNALMDMGLHVYGDYDSPVIPFLIYNPAKVAGFSHACLERGLAVVVVGFPATHVLMSRARICVSANLSKEDMDEAIAIISEAADLCCVKYNLNWIGCSKW
jgi:serine palmitoyltransferase